MNLFDALRPWTEVVLDQVPGPRAVRRPHPPRPERPGRDEADRRGARRLARAGGRPRRVRVPVPRARRLPRGQRRRARRRARGPNGLLVPFCRVNPHDDPAPRGRAQPGRRGPGDQAASARRGSSRSTTRAFGRSIALAERALAAGADPRRPRHPGARPARRRAGRGVPERAADPRPRRHLRPVLDLAGGRRPAEPAVRHRLVDPGRPRDAVLARAARADRVRLGRSLRQHVHLGRVPAPLGPRSSGSRTTRSARSRPSSRCGSPPASRRSRRDRRSASASGLRTCCSTASPSSCCSARSARCGASTRPRCSRSRASPATSPTRSTTRPCSPRFAVCSTTTRSTPPRTPTRAGGSRS